MPKNASGPSASPTGPTTSWRELAVARSLDSARARAETRVQRFLDAALELIGDGDTSDFTVQEVVDRSGQSLRSFYQYFGGKHELLLALFEESVRTTADVLREQVAGESGPVDRLHRFVIEYYAICRPAPHRKATAKAPGPMMVEFAQQLLTAHPAEASRAFVPLATLFHELLDEAAGSGALRDDLSRESIAGTVLEVIMFNAFSVTIGGASPTRDVEASAEELWDLLFNGIGARAA